MKNKKILIALFVLLLLGGGAFGGYKALKFTTGKYHQLKETIDEINNNTKGKVSKYNFDYSWMEGNVLVAHAFGGKGTKTYTNALEAFEYNYDLGHRVFEVDFDLTTDKKTICSHDEDYWRYITKNEDTEIEYSYENFKNTPLFTDYTPLDYMDIVNLLSDYPDIFIITDTKYFDETSVYQQFSQIVDYANEINPDVLDRLIPQIYTKEMLDYVMTIHPFKSVIFTLYQITWDAEDIAKFCIKSGVKFVTVSAGYVEEDNRIIDLWKSMNINIAVHTVNDKDEANMFLDKGIDMIYTDFLETKTFVQE